MVTHAKGHPATALLPNRRGIVLEVTPETGRTAGAGILEAETISDFERFDTLYRALCAVLYNFVPTSGHPGGSISSGRLAATLHFLGLRADPRDPDRIENDLLVYAAGHKAMGLYAMLALRNEVLRAGAPDLLPPQETRQLRLEDLLGFRRNPTARTPLFRELRAKALDGHPTPATPGVRIATGASGVGVPAGIGLAFAAIDLFGRERTPRVHMIEGEGGMTPGRVSEALACAATAGLSNIVLHVDWNQASIDADRVCREGEAPGQYVQWNPVELLSLHDWNVLSVPDGRDWQALAAALALSERIENDQPRAIVARTTKGWKYGIEGRASHGAGHKFCSPEYHQALAPCEESFGMRFPRHEGASDPEAVERSFWASLLLFRHAIEASGLGSRLGALLRGRLEALERLERRPRADAPAKVAEAVARLAPEQPPAALRFEAGSSTTLRGALGTAFREINRETGGAVIIASADLLGSTSISLANEGFAPGYFHARENPGSRVVACGGICEDAIGAFLAGVSSYGPYIGVGSSYAAFIAALQHVAGRLHAIGQQARYESTGEPRHAMVIVCAHAGLKTGEDGPTHADPQALQLLAENFPAGACITLTPWEPQEVWPLLIAGLRARPAILAPFVTRPNEIVPDRAALKLPPAEAAAQGIYALRKADPSVNGYGGTLVLQESGVVYAFVDGVLPWLDREGIPVNVYAVTSPELFDALPGEARRRIFPPEQAAEAIGITGFTLPTLYRWVLSEEGRAGSLHASGRGRYPGSGAAAAVMEEAGLDPASQIAAIRRALDARARRRR
jgi:transketolase